MGRVAERVGQQEGDDLAAGPRPVAHLLQAGGTFPEALRDQLVEREELHPTQSQAQRYHEQQPAGQAQGGPPIVLPAPEADQPPGCVECADHQGVIGDFDVTGQHGDAEKERACRDIRRLCIDPPVLCLLAHHYFDHRQDQRQPGGRGDDHGEVDADDEEAGERECYGRQRGSCPAQAQDATKDEHAGRGQAQLQPGEDSVSAPQRQDVEQDGEGIEARMLAGGQEGRPGEDARAPQHARQVTGVQSFPEE